MGRIVKALLIIISGSLLFMGCSTSGYSTSPLVKEIKNTQHFNKEVVDRPETIAVMFYTVACPTCREMKPLVADLAEKWKDEIKIVTVNCRTNTELIMEYEIHAVPRFVFFKNGEQLTEALRVSDKDELYALFDNHG